MGITQRLSSRLGTKVEPLVPVLGLHKAPNKILVFFVPVLAMKVNSRNNRCSKNNSQTLKAQPRSATGSRFVGVSVNICVRTLTLDQ